MVEETVLEVSDVELEDPLAVLVVACDEPAPTPAVALPEISTPAAAMSLTPILALMETPAVTLVEEELFNTCSTVEPQEVPEVTAFVTVLEMLSALDSVKLTVSAMLQVWFVAPLYL